MIDVIQRFKCPDERASCEDEKDHEAHTADDLFSHQLRTVPVFSGDEGYCHEGEYAKSNRSPWCVVLEVSEDGSELVVAPFNGAIAHILRAQFLAAKVKPAWYKKS
jgi:hypothetical protein